MLLAIPFPDISPEIFSFEVFGLAFALRWYALGYIVGLLLGWRIIMSLMRRPALWGGNAPMEAQRVEDLLTYMIIGVIAGGRLGFVLFYQPGYYLSHPLEILKVWEGGMSFHGGFLGVVVAGILFCYRNGLETLRVGDAIAAAAPPGIFLVRLANFINGELWGRPTTLPWAVEFPGAGSECPPDWLILCTRHPSQIYEALLEGLILGLILFAGIKWRRALHRPGQTIAVFLIGYGLSRMFVELFRQADAQFITPDNPMGYVLRLGEYGLSQGQLLSLPMVIVGAGLLIWSRKRA